ncbi:putative disease resistance protein At3g14460 [Juglans microcarpa x Juglans regia]|nr:putative disease resistance protein At3g14460 [Juglans microcarpa x Juglans regia]
MVLVGEMFLAASIQVLLERLSSPQFLNFVCRRRNQKRLGELSTIKMLLEDANEKQHTERDVKTWLDDLKDLVYDVEDILDELSIKASKRKLIGESQAASTSKVLNRIPALLTGLTPSAVKMKIRMRARITELTTRFDELMTRKDKLNLNQNSDGWSPNIIEEIIQPSICMVNTDRDQMHGRDRERDFILQLLLSETPRSDAALTKVNVIPIHGMAGIGKTTLAKFVYNNQEVQSYFYPKAWVCVSAYDGDFDVATITRAILHSMTPEINYNSMDLNPLQSKLEELINGKRFLIVLDDVRNEKDRKWTTLRAPFDAGASGSSIIITTRQQYVMSLMSTVEVPPCMLGLLPDKDCMSILAKHALDRRDFCAHQHLKYDAEEIVRKCEGLPLAVETVGSLLRVNNEYWKIVSNSKMWDILKKKKEIVPALMLSYHDLPPDLKRCFAYCSIFPKGYEFDEKQMVLLWMAEGLIQPGQQKSEMEDLGKEHFRNLLSRSFFQQSRQHKSRFLMHGLIKKLAKSVAGDTCYRMKLDRVKDREQGSIFEKTRHSSYLAGNYDGSEKFEVFSKLRCLRTFLPLKSPSLGDCYLAPNVPLQLIKRLRYLRVFCLRGYRITELSDSIGNLKHLRHLDLSETLIRSMPESITTLYNLQTLLLENCFHLNKLPSTLWKLVNLRHLNIQGAIHLEGMPMQIGKLTCLRSLSNMVVGKDSTCSGIKELGSLPHLRETLCISGLENVTEPKEAKDAALSNKPEITGLSLEWNEDTDEEKDRASELEVLENLEPHESLKELTIRYYGGRDFPTWLRRPSFLNMELLKIENCEKCTSLPAIGQLSSLKFLSIGGMAYVKNIGPEFCGNDISQPFRSLETLHFHDMKEWENWSPCEEFPKLRELSLRRCPKINGNLPNQLPSLKKVKIYGCGQLRISVPNIPDAYEIEVAGSKGVVHRSTVDFSSLEIRSLSKISMFTSEIVGFDKQWMTHAKDLTISTCEAESTHLWSDDCESLPDLPCLDLLCIESCPKLVSLVVGRKEELLQQDMPCPPTQIEIKNCIALKSLPKSLMYNNTRLKLIRIVKCDLLKHIARRQLPPTLERIEVSECKELEYLLDDIADSSSCSNTTSHLQYLKIQRCPSLKSLTSSGELPASLKHLDLLKCAQLKSIADRLHHNSCLECIVIVSCESLEYLPRDIHTLSTLREIDTTDCPSLSFSLSEEWLPANLRVLHISGCKKMALPKGIHNHTSLQSLTLHRCPDDPDDVSFPEEGFPTNLKLLSISHPKMIDALLERGLNKLTSLDNLEISGCPHLVSFPGQMKLPKSLTSLTISDFPNLRNLSCACLQNITSLNELIIIDCGKSPLHWTGLCQHSILGNELIKKMNMNRDGSKTLMQVPSENCTWKHTVFADVIVTFYDFKVDTRLLIILCRKGAYVYAIIPILIILEVAC